MMPHDVPPWPVVDQYQPDRRWLAAGCLETLVDDRRLLLRLTAKRRAQPTAAILDSRTLPSLPSPPERGPRGAQTPAAHRLPGPCRRRYLVAVDTLSPSIPCRRRYLVAVDTWLGHRLALLVTPANAQDRAQVEARAAQVQAVTGEHVERASVDQGSTGEHPEADAAVHGSALEVVKRSAATRGFVVLPKRWVVESTQPYYLQSALDVQTAHSHDRTHGITQPA